MGPLPRSAQFSSADTEVRTPQVQRGAGGRERVAPDPRSPSASASWRRQCPVGLVARLWGVIVLEALGVGGDTMVTQRPPMSSDAPRRQARRSPAPHPTRDPPFPHDRRGGAFRGSLFSRPGSAGRGPRPSPGRTAAGGAPPPADPLRRGAGCGTRAAGAWGRGSRAGGARPAPPSSRPARAGGGPAAAHASCGRGGCGRGAARRSRAAEPGAPSEPRVGPAAGPRRRRAAAPRAAPREQRRPPPPPP